MGKIVSDVADLQEDMLFLGDWSFVPGSAKLARRHMNEEVIP